MNHSSIELIIEDYILDLPEVRKTWPKNEFLENSYRNWAAQELLYFVISHTNISAVTAVGMFNKKMNDYYEMNHQMMFRIAAEVTKDILDVINASL